MCPVDNYTCDTNKLKPSAQEFSYWFQTTYFFIDRLYQNKCICCCLSDIFSFCVYLSLCILGG